MNSYLRAQIAGLYAPLALRGVVPTLVTVRLGARGGDIGYEKSLQKTLQSLGFAVRSEALPETVSQTELVARLRDLSRDASVHGLLLMQPLPPTMDAAAVKAAIAPEKDVDGATLSNLGHTLAGTGQGFTYCAPCAVMELLDYYKIPLCGAQVVLIGSGLVVGRPLAMLLADRFATVTMVNVHSKNVPALARQADILIAAAGVPHLVNEHYVREGQVVIDVGTTYRDGKLLGDVDWEAVCNIVQAATPTPGGIGGITTMILAKHLVQACTALEGLAHREEGAEKGAYSGTGFEAKGTGSGTSSGRNL